MPSNAKKFGVCKTLKQNMVSSKSLNNLLPKFYDFDR